MNSLPIEPQHFVHRPTPVEAVRLVNSAQAKRVAAWCGADCVWESRTGGKVSYLSLTGIRPDIHGRRAFLGDWIVRGEDGLFHRLADDEFNALYISESEPQP